MADSNLVKDLAELLNKHSCENHSGTPDYLLAHFLVASLHAYEETIQKRAEWRGESVELPALQALSKDLRTKKVPLVIYTEGRRNEIGEAEIEEWPGEVRVSGTITGVLPIVSGGIGSADFSIGPVRDPI
jgi:hypothetical protein